MIDFLVKVNKTEYCWNWTGYITKSGYGQFRFNGKTSKSHRVAYILTNGSLDDTLVIDHKCKNRKCVNPEHFDAVSQLENIRRGLSGKLNNHQLKKTHCPKGHKYSRVNKYGHRLCGKCRSMQTLKSKS